MQVLLSNLQQLSSSSCVQSEAAFKNWRIAVRKTHTETNWWLISADKQNLLNYIKDKHHTNTSDTFTLKYLWCVWYLIVVPICWLLLILVRTCEWLCVVLTSLGNTESVWREISPFGQSEDVSGLNESSDFIPHWYADAARLISYLTGAYLMAIFGFGDPS